MVIESERGFSVFDTEPHEQIGSFADIDHDVPLAFAAFLTMTQEVRDTNTHHQLQDDLVQHVWIQTCYLFASVIQTC
jgi:hypothetical protein